jgi:hypothetical protein
MCRPGRLVLADVVAAVEDQDAAAIEFLQEHAAGMGLVVSLARLRRRTTLHNHNPHA